MKQADAEEMKRLFQYSIFWVARLFTGLLLAVSGCSALVGFGILSDWFAVKNQWVGGACLVAGTGGVVAAFVLDGMATRAIGRWNSVPQARGFDVLPLNRRLDP